MISADKNSTMDGGGGAIERPNWPLLLVGIDFTLIFLCAVAGHFSVNPKFAANLAQSESIMEDTTIGSNTIDPTKKELPKADRELLKRPRIAYPTVILLIVTLATYASSIAGYVRGDLLWWQSTIISTIAVYWGFTVLHDAVHLAISPKIRWLNELCGMVGGTPLFAPLSMFRFIHLFHHRYSGDEDLDPDIYAGNGPQLLLPLRWLTILHNYTYFFARTMRMRQLSTLAESTKAKDMTMRIISGVHFLVVVSILTALYYLVPPERADVIIFAVLIPQRLAGMLLAYLFDYVPHRPHKIQYSEDPFKSTNATSLFGSVDNFFWNWTALGQQLHVVHHIWPFMPFYTYKDLWAVHGDEILAKGTRIAPLFILGSRDKYFDELIRIAQYDESKKMN